MGGVFIGARNRLTPSGVEIERYDIPAALLDRLKETFERLRSIL
jgi:hypothetical protein